MEHVMSNCQNCGAENLAALVNCTACGTTMPPADLPDDISQIWRIRFDLIEKAGGRGLPMRQQLSFGEHFRMTWNIWAFLFGPFYFLVKGMWRKALVYWLLGFVPLMLIDLASPDNELGPLKFDVNIAAAAWCMLRSNTDYYRKLVLKDNGWW
jgi:hypothetical protein